jgi:recombination protein RecT
MSNNQLAVIEEEIFSCREAFEARLVDRTMNFDAEAGFALQILRQSSYTLDIAYKQRQSVINAVTNVAALGVTLNPAKKHAYLVPRKPKSGEASQICLDISWMGLIDLAVRYGAIQWAQAHVVYERDSFKLRGYDQPPQHDYNPFSRDRGQVVGAYVVAKLPSGDFLTEVMNVDEIHTIRDRSEAWKSGKTCPWKTDYTEMVRKTVVKRASKYWQGRDSSGRLEQAIHYLNTDGGEGLADMAANDPQPPAATKFDADAWIARARKARTEKELTTLYGQAIAEAATVRDKPGAERFKAAALAQREHIRNNTIDMDQAA